MDPKEKGKTIGQLNGKWALMLKLLLAVHTVFILPALGWAIMITSSVYELKTQSAVSLAQWAAFTAIGPRYTQDDAEADQRALRAEMQTMIDRSIDRVEDRLNDLQKHPARN